MEQMPKFDFAKNMQEMLDYQKDYLNAVNVLLETGTPESEFAEADIIYTEDKMEVAHYKPLTSKKVNTPILIVYALVNREYMMDLQESRSFIRNLLNAGLDVYQVRWGYPTADDRYTTLDDYIDVYINNAVDVVREDADVEKINALGVCQGATFMTMYTALYQEKIKNLVTMVAPIDFHAGVENGLLMRWSQDMDVDGFVDAYNGIIPGDLLNASFDMLQPVQLMFNKYVTMAGNFTEPKRAANFLRMEKWVADSPDQAGEAFRRFIKEFYQENGLVKGTIEIGGKKVNLKDITIPVLNLYGEKDHIVPPEASIPLNDLIGSKDSERVGFPVGHIGMYVSSKSQGMIAPKVVEFLSARDK